ncbi:hypothetical protein FHK99_15050 [Cylindrospermopsis raciborskii CS-506_B]|nr:hypothetical protein [Cylindrospermopsis raciborskii]MBA4457393.1 hypothetical protein [Cylindrospermopsis raciborskii CS-506_B]
MQHKFNRDGGSSVIRKYAFISQQLYCTPDGRSHYTPEGRSLLVIALHPRRAIALSDYPPVPSQGKNLNMETGDREAFPTGSHIALPTGDRSW